jgi:hypothetical protein
MTLAELELRSAAARARLGDARVNLSAALTPAHILDSGFGAAMSGARRLMPEATKRIAGEAGKSLTTIVIGAIGSFIASRLTRQSHARANTSNKYTGTATSSAQSQSDGSSSKSKLSNTARFAKLAKTAAGGALALYFGSLLSKHIKPTALERHLMDRYAASFGSLYARVKSELPTTILRSSGIGGKASAALLAVSALAAVFKELDAGANASQKAA